MVRNFRFNICLEHLKLTYDNIYIEDLEDVPIHLYFEKAYDFIDKALFNGEVVGTIPASTTNEFEEFNEYSSQQHLVDMDIQTLKFDLALGQVSEWTVCEHKRAALKVDSQVHELRRLNPKHKVLVHCAMGKSRSATIVIMYIMKKFLLPFSVAKQLVSTRRETIEVNHGFLDQLKSFEQNDFKFPVESSADDSDSTEGEEYISPKVSK